MTYSQYTYDNMIPADYYALPDEIKEPVEVFYMNPATGSVASIEEWEKDFEDRENKSQNWEEWGGESLIAVIEKDGDWIEY